MAESRKADPAEQILKGIGVSPGVVVGPAHLLVHEDIPLPIRQVAPDEVEAEIRRFEDAVIETRRQIKQIQRDLTSRTNLTDGSILDAHLMVLDDEAFLEQVLEQLQQRGLNAEPVVKDAAERYAGVLASVNDEFLRERVADVRDVARRLLRNLAGSGAVATAGLPSRPVIIAEDLAPSETAGLRREHVSGFATDLGSSTCHSALMARALEIPAVVGLHDITRRVRPGDPILIDGNKGVLIVRPTPQRLKEYGKVAEARRHIELELRALHDKPAETRDGRRVALLANAESAEELDAIRLSGAEGVGLFRSEYLYLSTNRVVGEEEQAAVYERVAAALKPAPVVIRTLDMGGDKFMDGGDLHREANPFLGCRSIRLSLAHADHFRVQLRAILRASVHGNVKIMYPMISKAEEVIRANELLEEAKRELAARDVPFWPDIQTGVMIEIPGAALAAGLIAPHASFFSLGTNDLVQYTLAVDRRNERVAYLYEPTHPAVLSLIRMTIGEGHRHGLRVSVCGEMAADPLMTPLLLGMGVDELSMAPSAIPLVKDAVRSLTLDAARALAEEAGRCRSGGEVLAACRKLMSDTAPELLQLI
jgi:phosphotransferase system enzyme I (PtsI)